jgi:hypothetical protein
VQKSPTVSPYLNLLRPEDDLALPNYFAFVRPQLEQQRVNRQQQLEIERLGSQVQQVNNQLTYDPSGSNSIRPTGHQAVFMNLSHYYTFPGR